MRGFPKKLNTKQDYYNLLIDYPAKTKQELQKLLDTRYIWQDTKVLAEDETGIEDSIHRIVEQDGERIQQEYTEDSNARIFRLGFTVTEVGGVIND